MFDSMIITAGIISALVLLISSVISEVSSTVRIYSYTWFTFQVLIKFNISGSGSLIFTSTGQWFSWTESVTVHDDDLGRQD